MRNLESAQGDIYVNTQNTSPVNVTGLHMIGLKRPKKGGRLRIHAGEGRNHFHCLEGDVAVQEVSPMSTPKGIKAWNVFVGEGGAKLSHVTKSGRPTGEHGTMTLDPGVHHLRTQRELSNSDQAVRVID